MTKASWRTSEVKRGASRAVLCAGSYAIKIPRTRSWRGGFLHGLHGLIDNMNEGATWRHLQTDHEWLCPVAWSAPGGWVLIMRRALALTHEAELPPTIVSAARALQLEEWHALNVGWYEGRLVFLDYAT